MVFQDHFSAQAAVYARFRPIYPRALFEFLAAQTPDHNLAWDCGTGNGQAAAALAAHYTRVIASDPSAEQIAHASAHERVRYVLASAEQPPAEAIGADLVTAAQALHWFDFTRFYPALEAVLDPRGVFAAWGYGQLKISPAIDAVIGGYYTDIVGPYWPPERRHFDDAYRSIPFPLEEIATPAFEMTAEWRLEQLFGYLDSWSATRRYRAARGRDPINIIAPRLAAAWDGVDARAVQWPLFLRAGRRR
jgi:hypothetical protein